MIEKVSACPFLDLNDPDVGIETELARHRRFDLAIGSRLLLQDRDKSSLGWMRVIESCLGGRTIKIGGTIQTIDLNENRACLFGTAPQQHGRRSLDLTSSQVRRDPDR
jgi:hypothetical protein